MQKKEQFKLDVEKYLNSVYNVSGDDIVILDDETIEKDSYYVFFYINKRYLDTNNISDMIAGNAPVIVDKKTGLKHTTGTAFDIEYYIKKYENENNQKV